MVSSVNGRTFHNSRVSIWIHKISSSRFLSVFNAIATPATFAGIVFSIWSARVPLSNPQEVINLIVGGTIVFGSAATIALVVLSCQVVDAHRTLADVQRDNAFLQTLGDEAGARAHEVAVHFNMLSQAILDHERQAQLYIACTLEAPHAQDEQWDELLRCWEQCLSAICDTAATVLPIQRGLPVSENGIATCSANIKEFRRVAGPSPYYIIRKRSRLANPRRSANDKKSLRPVLRNLMYMEMLRKDRENLRANLPRELYHVQNTDVFLGRFKEQSLRRLFDEPTLADANFYKSCIICPVGDDPWIGLLCIDSMKYDFFNDNFDRLIVTQLTNQYLSVARRQFEAEEYRRPLTT